MPFVFNPLTKELNYYPPGLQTTANKATDFSIINNNLYPTVQAVETRINHVEVASLASWAGLFNRNYIVGTESSPVTGNITVTDTGAIDGCQVTIYHNDSTAPTVSGGTLSPVFNQIYVPNKLNVIVIQYIGGTFQITYYQKVDYKFQGISIPLVRIFDSFMQNQANVMTAVASGTGAGFNQTTNIFDQYNLGIKCIEKGTTTTGSCRYGLTTTSLDFQYVTAHAQTSLYLSNLSDATDTYVAMWGFNDSTTTIGGDSVLFYYTHSANSGRWSCYTSANSVQTVTNTAIAPSTTAYQRLAIEGNGSVIYFYIDGVLVATHTTNIPNTSARSTGFFSQIIASAGTNNRYILERHRLLELYRL